MKALLLYNPLSGKGHRITRNINEICAIFRRNDIELKPKRLSFAENPFKGDEEVELAVVCGGDGTLNYVINRMREAGINLTLGIIPSGTANDFAGALGMSRRLLVAARQIAEGRERKVDCGKANGRYFINVLSFGLLTTTSQHTSDREKRMLGKIAYIREGLRDLVRMHGIPLHIKSDSEEFDSEALMLLVFNGRTAGRITLARGAAIDDGLFDVLLLKKRNPVVNCLDMARHLVGGGTHAVLHFRTSKLEISTSVAEPTDVDGQPGPNFPIEITCEKGALTFRC